MNFLITFNPCTRGGNSKSCLNSGIVKELVRVAQIVAQGRLIALLSNIIDIEVRGKWISKNYCHVKLTELKSFKIV